MRLSRPNGGKKKPSGLYNQVIFNNIKSTLSKTKPYNKYIYFNERLQYTEVPLLYTICRTSGEMFAHVGGFFFLYIIKTNN